MSEWQPIETAPMETPVLLFVPGFSYPGSHVNEIVMAVGDTYSEGGDVTWDLINDGDGGSVNYGPCRPTHWMPFPEPPTA